MNPGPPKLNSGGPPKWSPKLHSPKDFGDPKKSISRQKEMFFHMQVRTDPPDDTLVRISLP